MDLLFKRYASPFLFIDGMLKAGRFSEFVDEFIQAVQKEEDDNKTWEFYLYRVQEGTYKDFKEKLENDRQNRAMSASTIEATVQHSMNILNNFIPEE